MDNFDYWVLMVYLGLLIIIALLNYYRKEWKKKYEKAHERIYAQADMMGRLKKQIEKLQNELKTYKDMKRVIKVEKVIMQPRELECKFMLHERFVDDTELFKKVITSEVARYMAEELNKDPYLCKIYHDRISFYEEGIKVRFRMLPYAEGVVWDDIFKEDE